MIIDSDRHVLDPDERLLPFMWEGSRGRKRAPTSGRYHPIWGSLPMPSPVSIPRDGREYLSDMDAEWVDVAFLYPSAGLWIALVNDYDAAARLASEYNNWLADFCSSAPNRLKSAALVAPQHVSAAVHE